VESVSVYNRGRVSAMIRTKVVCTIGPASRSPEALERLVRAGMDVAPLNFSHGTPEEHGRVISRLRRIDGRLGRPVAILQDLAGPTSGSA
jgi:pyruvate kinase